MFLTSSRLTPKLNAHVYCISRSGLSTIGPAVTVFTKPPARTCDRNPTRNALHAGLMAAMPAFDPATGLRHAVRSGVDPTGNVPVCAGDVTCAVSYASVGAITWRCASVMRIGVWVY